MSLLRKRSGSRIASRKNGDQCLEESASICTPSAASWCTSSAPCRSGTAGPF
ncbi:hypothetical protein Mapa_000490 [Marchantia paleacea]|nr:hypothetical protein Mapa_000490 [Marchantia paleacea]